MPLTWRYAPPVHSGLRAAHAAAAVLFMCSTIALLCVTLVRRLATRGRPSSGWVAGVAVVVAAVVGILTGRMIAWDWIGLRAVTVGSNSRGVLRAGFSDQVRFVVIDGTEVAPSTYRFWVIVHLVCCRPFAPAVGSWLRCECDTTSHSVERRHCASSSRHCPRHASNSADPGRGSAPASASQADDPARWSCPPGRHVDRKPDEHRARRQAVDEPDPTGPLDATRTPATPTTTQSRQIRVTGLGGAASA